MTESVKSKNDDVDTYIGISFPLTRGNNGFFQQTKTLLEQAGSNLRNLLLTMKGERVSEPDFGSDLHRIIFEQLTDDIAIPIEEAILEAVDIWLPYISIGDIEVGFDEQDSNRIIIKLTFSVSIEPNENGKLALVFNTAG